MLVIPGAKQRFCDGMNRRTFLQVGALGVGGLTLADLLRLRAAAGPGPSRARPKSIIMILQSGGPSHIDTYDLKPEAAVEFRGEFKPIATNVVGVQISEQLPLQAKIWDKLAVVRNLIMQKGRGDHTTRELLTGFYEVGTPQRPGEERPAFGSVISRLCGGTDLPAYVSLNRGGRGENPAYVGMAHRPFVPSGPAFENLRLAGGMTYDQIANRKELLRVFDSVRRDLDATGTMSGMDDFTARALDIVSSNKARAAFDISKEPEAARKKYGPLTHFLQARRLVEAGVAVVTLEATAEGWDSHGKNFQFLRGILPKVDQAVHALVSDLCERGLDRDVMVVMWGEFGRTPKINKDAGRDHWGPASYALIAGGGLQMGQAIGQTNERGEHPRGRHYTASNVLATIYHALGIDPASTLPDHAGRPMHLLEDRGTIAELL